MSILAFKKKTGFNLYKIRGFNLKVPNFHPKRIKFCFQLLQLFLLLVQWLQCATSNNGSTSQDFPGTQWDSSSTYLPSCPFSSIKLFPWVRGHSSALAFSGSHTKTSATTGGQPPTAGPKRMHSLPPLFLPAVMVRTPVIGFVYQNEFINYALFMNNLD